MINEYSYESIHTSCCVQYNACACNAMLGELERKEKEKKERGNDFRRLHYL